MDRANKYYLLLNGYTQEQVDNLWCDEQLAQEVKKVLKANPDFINPYKTVVKTALGYEETPIDDMIDAIRGAAEGLIEPRIVGVQEGRHDFEIIIQGEVKKSDEELAEQRAKREARRTYKEREKVDRKERELKRLEQLAKTHGFEITRKSEA
jgi:hypothetical protein